MSNERTISLHFFTQIPTKTNLPKLMPVRYEISQGLRVQNHEFNQFE